jgi:hypothetical protein
MLDKEGGCVRYERTNTTRFDSVKNLIRWHKSYIKWKINSKLNEGQYDLQYKCKLILVKHRGGFGCVNSYINLDFTSAIPKVSIYQMISCCCQGFDHNSLFFLMSFYNIHITDDPEKIALLVFLRFLLVLRSG